MRVLDAEFVKDFMRMAGDGWDQGWHERNGGNLSYRRRSLSGRSWPPVTGRRLAQACRVFLGSISW